MSLEDLIGGSQNASVSGEFPSISLNSIVPGKYQPRTEIPEETLEEIAQSIKVQGVIQPIVVREITTQDPSIKYEIVAGERRWRASQMVGLTEIPAVIKKDVTDQAAIAMALIENMQREELNPIQESKSIKRLIEEFELTHQEAADAIGRSRSAVTNLLRLLDLGDQARQALENGKIEQGHAKVLLSLPTYLQDQVVKQIIQKSLSVRKTEEYIKGLLSTKPETKNERDPRIEEYQQSIAEVLKSRVKLNVNNSGKGSMTIYFQDAEKLNEIMERLNKMYSSDSN